MFQPNLTLNDIMLSNNTDIFLSIKVLDIFFLFGILKLINESIPTMCAYIE